MAAQRFYRRNLPHFQAEGRTFFVTFCTKNAWELPPRARDVILDRCINAHGRTAIVHTVVVIPDHVHLVVTPLRDSAGEDVPLERILREIKGASAREINELLDREGSVWQAESFDHMLRTYESMEGKVEYVCQNPVRKGLASRPGEYKWLWRLSERIPEGHM